MDIDKLTEIQKAKLQVHLLYLSSKENEVFQIILKNPKIKQREIANKVECQESYVSKIIHKLASKDILDKSRYSNEFEFKL